MPSTLIWYHGQSITIRDGEYLARHMPVLGNVHPIKIENVDIFFVTSFLCSHMSQMTLNDVRSSPHLAHC